MGHFTTIGCRSLYQVKKTDRDRQGEESAERGCTLKQGSPSKKWRACPLQLAPYLWWLLVLPPWLPLLFQPLHLSTCPDGALSVLFSKNKSLKVKKHYQVPFTGIAIFYFTGVQILDQQHLSISEGPSFQGNTWQNKFVIVDKEGNICLPILGHKSNK